MTFEKSVKHNDQNRLSMGIAAVVVGILIVVILVACAGLASRLHSNRERIAELEAAKVKEEQRQQDSSFHERSPPMDFFAGKTTVKRVPCGSTPSTVISPP